MTGEPVPRRLLGALPPARDYRLFRLDNDATASSATTSQDPRCRVEDFGFAAPQTSMRTTLGYYGHTKTIDRSITCTCIRSVILDRSSMCPCAANQQAHNGYMAFPSYHTPSMLVPDEGMEGGGNPAELYHNSHIRNRKKTTW